MTMMKLVKKMSVAAVGMALFTAVPVSALTHSTVEAASRKKTVKQVAVPGLVQLKSGKTKAQVYYKNVSRATKKNPYTYWDPSVKKTRKVTKVPSTCFYYYYGNVQKIRGKKYFNLNHGFYLKASDVDACGQKAIAYYHKNGKPYISKSKLMKVDAFKRSKNNEKIAAITPDIFKVLKTVKIKGKTYYQVGKDKYLKKGDAVLLSDK